MPPRQYCFFFVMRGGDSPTPIGNSLPIKLLSGGRDEHEGCHWLPFRVRCRLGWLPLSNEMSIFVMAQTRGVDRIQGLSEFGGKAENICSHGVFRILTMPKYEGRQACAVADAVSPGTLTYNSQRRSDYRGRALLVSYSVAESVEVGDVSL